MPLSLLILIATVQGLTEFLPVSSSVHLVLIPIITNFDYQGRLIDVAAHVGTLIAVTLYLRIEIIAIIIALFAWGAAIQPTHALVSAGAGYNTSCYRRLFCQLRGLALVRYGANTSHCQFWICHHFMAQRYLPIKKRGLGSVTWSAALLIGLAQICALFPEHRVPAHNKCSPFSGI